MENIKVSVLCLVYNHAQFLRTCLDGFVMQKCNFKFEVIVHDDASTDGSADILREYEAQYPDIIKPIYQTENQYSKGSGRIKSFMYPKIRGEYVAWCEGDDHWTSPHKLQKQVDFLDSHPDFAACTHRAIFNVVSTGKSFFFPSILNSRKYSADEVIKAGGLLFAANSLMMRTEKLLTMPDCYMVKGVGDYQKPVYSAIEGGIWCLSDIMSQYNAGVPGSWTSRTNNNVEKRTAHLDRFIHMLKEVDAYYNYKYHEAFDYTLKMSETEKFMINNDKKALKDPVYKPFVAARKKALLKSNITKRFPIVRNIWVSLTKKK